MTDQRCVHDLLPGQCADCKAPPPGVRKLGYRTKAGAVFHNERDCSGLLEGQQFARYKGMDVHEPERLAWAEAQARGLAACQVCCSERAVARQDRLKATAKAGADGRPCLVRVDEEWFPGTAVWLPKRDGLWWAEVTYRHQGRWVVATKSQRDLRPRPDR
ncbi:hypothetical protein [Crossiella sp. NPDC003009]